MNKLSYKNFISLIKDKKYRTYFIVVLFGLFFTINWAIFASPKIYLTTQIKNVTEKDYNIFIVNNDGIPLEKKTRDNCRFISVNIKIEKPLILARNVKLEKVTLEEYLDETQFLNKNTNEFHALGTYTASNLHNESAEGIDVYLDGMTDEKIKKFFGDYKIEVSWIDLFNKKHKEIFYLKDYFQ
jgi:hypothetical protein